MPRPTILLFLLTITFILTILTTTVTAEVDKPVIQSNDPNITAVDYNGFPNRDDYFGASAFPVNYNHREASFLLRFECSVAAPCGQYFTLQFIVPRRCLYGTTPSYSAVIHWFNQDYEVLLTTEQDPFRPTALATPWNINNPIEQIQTGLVFAVLTTIADRPCGYERSYHVSSPSVMSVDGVVYNGNELYQSTQPLWTSELNAYLFKIGYFFPTPSDIADHKTATRMVFNMTYFPDDGAMANSPLNNIEIIPVGLFQLLPPSLSPLFESTTCYYYRNRAAADANEGTLIHHLWNYTLTGNMAIYALIVSMDKVKEWFHISCRADYELPPHFEQQHQALFTTLSLASVSVQVNYARTATPDVIQFTPSSPYALLKWWDLHATDPMNEGRPVHNHDDDPDSQVAGLHTIFPVDSDATYMTVILRLNCSSPVIINADSAPISACDPGSLFLSLNPTWCSLSRLPNDLEINYSTKWFDADLHTIHTAPLTPAVNPIQIPFDPETFPAPTEIIYAIIRFDANKPCLPVPQIAEFLPSALTLKSPDTLSSVVLSSRSKLMRSTPLFLPPPGQTTYSTPTANFTLGYKYHLPPPLGTPINPNDPPLPQSELRFNFTITTDVLPSVSALFPGFEIIPLGLLSSEHPKIHEVMSNMRCVYAPTRRDAAKELWLEAAYRWERNPGIERAWSMRIDLFPDDKPLQRWQFFRVMCVTKFDIPPTPDGDVPLWLPNPDDQGRCNIIFGAVLRPLDYSNQFIFTKLLDFSLPNNRPGSAAHFSFRNIILEGEEDPVTYTPPHRPRNTRWIKIVAIVLFVVAILGIAAFFGIRRILYIREYNRQIDRHNARIRSERVKKFRDEQQALEQEEEKINQYVASSQASSSAGPGAMIKAALASRSSATATSHISRRGVQSDADLPADEGLASNSGPYHSLE